MYAAVLTCLSGISSHGNRTRRRFNWQSVAQILHLAHAHTIFAITISISTDAYQNHHRGYWINSYLYSKL